ncbi:hypothetical protein H310_05586 [Aphanomyces invadans]|uniref:FAM86 N-terminal domain-containing protein n=1 Tax=Aphanomyces invadans TaxID=157072 RepID=A0A024UA67_9STRA|nr:hypothetical protein H310_05586 [Aphanomyces invadans]ETW03169.1 hypothetical protein H310_05586 [Aphanomyces invadans]RHY32330.1 hypothetical protein DYB32_002643 [Aphanomyces invadans]|eukprot:XP_008868553.1 hypothetical protein H310_05586 [Aphanomyces invadans]
MAENAQAALEREMEIIQHKLNGTSILHDGGDDQEADEDLLADVGFMYDDCLEKVTCEFTFGVTSDSDPTPRVSVFLSYVQDDPGFVQSGHYVWPAAPALCEYMEAHFKELPRGNVVELGAGCGLAGLVFAQLDPSSTIIFTDHDPGVLKTIEHNVTKQSHRPVHAACHTQSLRWGPQGANEIDRIAALQGGQKADLIVGTDVIYAREIVALLFWTVHQLLKKSTSGEGNHEGQFLMCSSFSYDEDTENEIDVACAKYALVRTIVTDTLESKGTRIQQFVRRRE